MSLAWKLRRVALRFRQLDVAAAAKISQSRYCLLERGDAVPTDAEREVIEHVLKLPVETAREVVEAVGSLTESRAG